MPASYIKRMRASLTKALVLAVAAVLALGAFDDASAARKKRQLRADAPLVERDYDGTPIIMKGFRRPPAVSIMKDEPGTGRVTDAPRGKAVRRHVPRGSGSYIPPPNPSPSSSSLPPTALTRVPPASPPPIQTRTFNDRVINCIHSAPLNAGVGNNPSDRQAYIRQCSN